MAPLRGTSSFELRPGSGSLREVLPMDSLAWDVGRDGAPCIEEGLISDRGLLAGCRSQDPRATARPPHQRFC